MAHFITIEGGEGTGKSTQARLLGQYLQQRGQSVILTREPGGTEEGEALRNLLLKGHADRWSAESEALLNYAARDAHLRHVIRPALNSGSAVVCDRFMDSTTAYQGYAGGCDLSFLNQLSTAICGPTIPTITLVFDLDPILGLARVRARNVGATDRFEAKGLAFHQRLRDGFRDIAKTNPKRCILIDASGTLEQVSGRVLQAVERRLNG